MRLLTLELENYRRFAHAALELGDGVTGLVGRNGAGKSTIVEALGWALFGHEASRTGKDHLRRRDAKGDCRVRATFELGGQDFEVMREVTAKGAHTAVVKVGGKVLVAAGANSAREATGALERALGMDRDTFFTSLVARQGELSALSDLTPGKRKEVVMRMLRIDAIEGAIALAREERRRVQAHLAGLAGQRVDAATLAARAKALQATRGTEAALAAQAAQALEAVEASLAAVAKAREAAEEQRQRHDALASQARVLAAQVETAQRAAQQGAVQLRDLDVLQAEAARLAPEAAEHLRLRTAVEGLEALRDRHRERIRLLAEAAELEKELEQATTRHEALLAEVAQSAPVRAELEGARTARALAEAALAQARALLGVFDEALRGFRLDADRAARRREELARLGADAPCPTCERSLAEALPRLLAATDQELADRRLRVQASERRASHQAQLVREAQLEAAQRAAREDAAKKRAEHLLRAETEAEGQRKRRADLEQRLRVRRDGASRLGEVPFDEPAYLEQKRALAASAKAHERVLQLQARLDQRPALEEARARHEADATRLRAEAFRVAAEQRVLGHDPEQRRALEERFLGLQQRARTQDVELARRRGAVERLDGELANLAKQEEEQRAIELKAAEMRRDLALLERLAGDRDAGLMADFRSHLMGRLRPALAARAGALFRGCTEGRYDGLDLSEDYDLLVLEQGAPLPLARFSGGEADLANLCLRIAIGELLADRGGEQLGFLVLDEVLGSQDEQRRARILGALAHLQARFRQILLITHIEEVKESLEHVVYVEDAADGTSRLAARQAALVAA